jgi:hypothetical protein
MDLIREMAQGNSEAPEDKKAVAAKITAMAKPMIALQSSLIEEDVQVLKADQELAGKLHDISPARSILAIRAISFHVCSSNQERWIVKS